MRYLSVQEHGPRTWQIALQRAHLGRDASLKSSVVALGGDYARLRSESLLSGQGGESDLTAVYFGDGAQMLDFRTLQDHDAPNTRSDLLFKGAVEDTAQSVYSGLIRIRKHAQKSNAYQTNRNLVLTEGAEAKSVPNLEIEADDVQVLARQHGRPGRRRPALLPGDPRRAARGSGAAHRARLLRRRLRPTACTVAGRAAPAQRRREDRAPRPDPRGPDVGRARACSVADVQPGTAARFDVDGHRLCVVHVARLLVRDRRRVLARRLLALRGRGVGGRVRDRVPQARVDVLPRHRRAADPPRHRPVPVYAVRVDGDDVIVTVVNVQRCMSLLKIDGLHATVDGQEILRGVDLEVNSGEVHALMGPNGSGKSHALPRAHGPRRLHVTGGSVTIDGDELLGLPTHERAAPGSSSPCSTR